MIPLISAFFFELYSSSCPYFLPVYSSFAFFSLVCVKIVLQSEFNYIIVYHVFKYNRLFYVLNTSVT